jgi:hypothetical protein
MTVTINGTTGIVGVDGSAATPAVKGTDTNTGIFFPAADTIAFTEGGSESLRIGSSGQIGIGGANYGTSGQVLTSGGASAAPSWAAVSASGQLLRAPQVLTSGTSYTTPANCTAIYVEAVGGGGGTAAQNGAGAGAYCAKYFSVSASTPYTYAIGSGGSTGVAGGSTTFTVGATTITAGGGAAAKTGGTATNGDINVGGGSGGGGNNFATTPAVNIAGAGGNSYFGGGGSGTAVSSTANGTSALGYGGGAGGNGFVGFQGIIRIWEYS